MSDHMHNWMPAPGHRAAYDCVCGATGYRNRHGDIRPHKRAQRRQARATALPAQGTVDGRVLPKPVTR